jgi:protein-S-isoprenylcysteine O-methyltransferase Ste14
VFVRASEEDEGLKQEFGREWEMWAEKVPYKLFPGIF